MGLSDLLLKPEARARQRTGRLLLQQLTRIADALERLSPPTSAPLPDSVSVDDVDLKLQAAAEVIEQELWRKLGRMPTDEEILAEYEETKHLR